MRVIRNFDEANTALADFIPAQKIKEPYSLERMRALMDFLDNPQDKLKVVHVAGTSGKTSTGYYVAALLKAAGYKTGLTVSPHVVAVNDRLQIDLEPLPELEYGKVLAEFIDLIEQSGLKLTYFELVVALAYFEFDRQKVNWAIVEVGMGGLLDGTNVVTRADKLCIITDIGLDHVNVLGKTLPEIAAQKAGIIQPGNVVFSHRLSNKVIKVFQKKCAEQKANLKLIDDKSLSPELNFLPLFQRRNFVLAQAAVGYLLQRNHRAPLTARQLRQAAVVHIPARMEIFKHAGKTIILDGAHNAQKLQALIASIKAKFGDQTLASLVSFAAGDEYRLSDSLKEITKVSSHIIATSFAGEQDVPKISVDPSLIKGALAKLKFKEVQVVDQPESAFTKLLARSEPVLLVTGSFYLLNHIRPLVLKLKND